MREPIDITGQQFGYWTALYYVGGAKWHCRCKCGAEKEIGSFDLRRGRAKSCGCMERLQYEKAMIGRRFGRLVVLSRADDRILNCGKRRILWNVRCDCGNERVVGTHSLFSGETQSCGCLGRERVGNAHRKHGQSGTRLYNLWNTIKARCEYATVNGYKNYGGRGIKVCDEWRNNYQAFRDWAYENGYDENAPKGQYTIDRIDVNGNYEPSNCRWIDNKTQQNNRRNNHFLELNGEKHTVKEWSEITGLKTVTILSRIQRGWDTQRVLQDPLKINGHKYKHTGG